jgi:hypothetical protein
MIAGAWNLAAGNLYATIRAGRWDSRSVRVRYYRGDEKIRGGLDWVHPTVPTCPATWPCGHRRGGRRLPRLHHAISRVPPRRRSCETANYPPYFTSLRATFGKLRWLTLLPAVSLSHPKFGATIAGHYKLKALPAPLSRYKPSAPLLPSDHPPSLVNSRFPSNRSSALPRDISPWPELSEVTMVGLESVFSSLTCHDAHRPSHLNSTAIGTSERGVATVGRRHGHSLRQPTVMSLHLSSWPSSLSHGELLKLIILPLRTLPHCITRNGSVKVSGPRALIGWALGWSSCPIFYPWSSAKSWIRCKSKFERGLWSIVACASSTEYWRCHPWSGTWFCEEERRGDLFVNVSDSKNSALD